MDIKSEIEAGLAGPEREPRLRPGNIVRLRRKPEKLRAVTDVRFHAKRLEYVYIVETSHPSPAYWFFDDLIPVEPEALR